MSSDRKRNDRGEYVETVTPEGVLEVMRRSPDPIVTAKEVGEALGRTSEAARQKLLKLQDEGIVARRKVGAGAVVWWIVDADREGPVDEFDPSDPLFTDPVTFSSGETDVSANTDAYLADAIAGKSDGKNE
ncbi:FaeA/PapI family transcriptional regulator [Natrinema sp. SYSU A 869]|uniref:FaeA/PapI family transcriptional regulator n=1 Tax=Natrinema sp. SYSU A 869 TaxID=2871694 RepID=UPI001CA4102C|nr:FaeA/PapI family transcriptional regulator [Natrinema sp. SYSU A 869]